MDNIKKYEDFLDRMQGLLDNAKKQGHIIVRVEDLENAFPELKESEDERIREYLIRYIDNTMKSSELKSKLLAWLEKQGEQNDSDVKDYNSIDPHFGKPIDKIEPNFNFKVGQWIVATGKCVYFITKIDGFNVTLVDVDGNEYVFDTSSLEDAHLLTIDDVQNGCKRGAKWQGKHDVSEEWSEEDEELVKWSINNLTELKDRFGEEYGKVGKCIDWLKSLKQRYTWKPSEEQLKSLKEVIDVGHFTSYPNALETLYEQLKKLREE